MVAKLVEDVGSQAPATLRITTKKVALSISKIPFRVAVDGEAKGNVSSDRKMVIRVPPGPHTLKVKAGTHARVYQFSCEAGQDINLRTELSFFAGLLIARADEFDAKKDSVFKACIGVVSSMFFFVGFVLIYKVAHVLDPPADDIVKLLGAVLMLVSGAIVMFALLISRENEKGG